MSNPLLQRSWRLGVAVAVLLGLTACTPLPAYPFTYSISLDHSDGRSIVLAQDEGGEPLISGQLMDDTNAQERDLYMLVGGTVDEIGAFVSFSRNDDDTPGTYLETLTVIFDGETYERKDVATDQIPDAFTVEKYVDPEFPDALGRITGGFSTTVELTPTPDDGTTLTVTMSGFDALVRARD